MFYITGLVNVVYVWKPLTVGFSYTIANTTSTHSASPNG